MQVNSRKNFTDKTEFGKIKLGSNAEYALKKTLKPNDWVSFNEIIYKQQNNKEVDIILFGRNGFSSPKIAAQLDPRQNNILAKRLSYRQGLFESTIKFIEKLNQQADLYAQRLAKLKDINPQKILDKIDRL